MKGKVPEWYVDKDNVIDYSVWGSTEPADEELLRKGLYKNGPIAVAINAEKLMMYTGGIIDETDCDPEALDHAVFMIGYGTENGTDHWIIKNSWGTSWGEAGTFRFKRNVGTCGVNSCAS